MCARLLACPLCSQPGFLTLDALRAGLVSVATRPLACPVCNEVLLGIDKLTIHLFGHTITSSNTVVGGGNESAKIMEVTAANNAASMVRNAQIQSWNVMNQTSNRQIVDGSKESTRDGASGIYIPIDEIDTYRNLTAITDGTGGIINVNGSQAVATTELKAPSQVIFLQNVPAITSSQPKIIATNLSAEHREVPSTIVSSTATATSASLDESESMDQTCRQDSNVDDAQAIDDSDIVIIDNDMAESDCKDSYRQSSMLCQILTHTVSTSSTKTLEYPTADNDRLAELIKSANIASSPRSSVDSPKPPSPEVSIPSTSSTSKSSLAATTKLLIKSTRIISSNEHTERCNICGFHFPDRNILILHKKLVHNIQEKDSNVSPDDLMKNYPCHLCTKVFKMRGSLMVHMRVAHPSFNMVKEGLNLDQHEQESEQLSDSKSPTGDNAYNCPVCRKSFKREQLVIQHMRIHDSKQFECDVCSKLFTTKYFLKKHKRLHSGEMPYKCNICDKTFTFQQSFHKHRLYHRDEKPHSCTTCGRSFKELSTLHNHERIHTGEKPFVCESCGKCFRQRVSYLVHRRIHTGAMPYECKNCGRVFRYKVSQRTHKCTNHVSNENSPESADMRETHNVDEESMDATTSEKSKDEQFLFALNDESQNNDTRLTSNLINDLTTDQNLNEVVRIDGKGSEESSISDGFIQRLWNEHTRAKMDFKESNEKVDDIVSAIKNTEMWSNQNDDNACQLSCNEKFLTKEFSTDLWAQSGAEATPGAAVVTTAIKETITNQMSYEKEIGKEQEQVNDNSATTQPDFYSMLENDISSPSAEMEHLRLSSPMQTINEDSLKELLSCIP